MSCRVPQSCATVASGSPTLATPQAILTELDEFPPTVAHADDRPAVSENHSAEEQDLLSRK